MAFDCHLHVFGGRDSYPLLRPGPGAQVPVATADQLRERNARLGITGGVLINPVEYHNDTACLEDALASNPGLCGAVMADAGLDEAALCRLDAKGVRGLRLMFPARIGLVPDDGLLDAALGWARRFGWHLRILASPDDIERVNHWLAEVDDVPILLEHLAIMPPERAIEGEAPFDTLTAMLRRRNVWLQLSGHGRLAGATGMDRVVALARRYLDIAEGRLVWGSDWPLQADEGEASSFAFASRVAGTGEGLRRILEDESKRMLQII